MKTPHLILLRRMTQIESLKEVTGEPVDLGLLRGTYRRLRGEEQQRYLAWLAEISQQRGVSGLFQLLHETLERPHL